MTGQEREQQIARVHAAIHTIADELNQQRQIRNEVILRESCNWLIRELREKQAALDALEKQVRPTLDALKIANDLAEANAKERGRMDWIETHLLVMRFDRDNPKHPTWRETIDAAIAQDAKAGER